jgi:hypothetical protein
MSRLVGVAFGWSELETEWILLAAARVGQHVFDRQMLANCGSWCVFCGLRPSTFGATRMLMAGHIKPWKDSTPAERLDPCNGLAACPAHNVAFDTGMITVNGGLRIHLVRPLAEAIQTDQLALQFYGRPPLREVIPELAQVSAQRTQLKVTVSSASATSSLKPSKHLLANPLSNRADKDDAPAFALVRVVVRGGGRTADLPLQADCRYRRPARRGH